MIAIPLYSGSTTVSDGQWAFETFPDWTPVIISLISAGSSFSIGGIKLDVEQVSRLDDGGLWILANISGTGGNAAGLKFDGLLGGALSGIAAKLVGQVIRKVSKVYTGREELAIYAGLVAGIVAIVFLSIKAWKRWR